MKDARIDRFMTSNEGKAFIEPQCKKCKYAIDKGVNGCKKECQTLEIKFAEKVCPFYCLSS